MKIKSENYYIEKNNSFLYFLYPGYLKCDISIITKEKRYNITLVLAHPCKKGIRTLRATQKKN